MYELLERGNIDKVFPQVSSAAAARFCLRRASFPLRPLCPLVAGGVAGQVSTAALPTDFESHCGVWDLGISFASARVELAVRGGHSTEPGDSLIPSFDKLAPASFSGMIRVSWRSSHRWVGHVDRPVGIALSPGKIPAHAGRTRAFNPYDSPRRLPHDLNDMGKYRGSLEFPQWRISECSATPVGSF